MQLDDIKKATSIVKPNNLVWVIVGDKAQIEEAIKAKNFGAIIYIDVDGNAI